MTGHWRPLMSLCYEEYVDGVRSLRGLDLSDTALKKLYRGNAPGIVEQT
jgi:hypothetical protein